jgi:hypothetical protein
MARPREFDEVTVLEAAINCFWAQGFESRCITSGQKDGTISPARPPAELAKVLFSVLLGIRVLARTRPQRAVLAGAVSGDWNC